MPLAAVCQGAGNGVSSLLYESSRCYGRRMEFRVLGPLEVEHDGLALDVRGSKRRALLALLVLHANEVIRSDRLIEELWGEHPPANASAALHSHISRLRKDLGGDVLVTKPWGYVLRADPEAIDVQRFERLLAEARPLAAGERRGKLTEALALWRGPALTDLGIEPAFEVETARLEDLRLSALEQRIDADLELGLHEALVPELEGLVGEHPLRKQLRGQLILALYRSGRQAEALETYRETRRVLVEELGIEPSSELRELERAILRQDPSLGSAPSVPRLPAALPPPTRWRLARSPLALGAALVLLAAGGAAAAMLLTQQDGSDQLGAPPAALAAPVSSTITTSGSNPSAKAGATTRAKARRHPPAETTRVRRLKHSRLAAAIAQPEARQKAGAEPPPPPPAPNPPPPPSPWVYWLADDFTDPGFDYGMWNLGSNGRGVEAAERNNRLEFTIASDVVLDPQYGVDQHYGTNCFVRGDFDVTVEFDLLTWPASNGVNVTLGALFPPPRSNWLAVERAGGRSDGTPEAYDSNIGSQGIRTDDSKGALRLRRKSGVLSGYYRYRETWVSLGSRVAPAQANLVVSFNSGGVKPVFGHQAASAAVDNFEATADGVDCPGAPLPPRKRRG